MASVEFRGLRKSFGAIALTRRADLSSRNGSFGRDPTFANPLHDKQTKGGRP
jgi:hypothetical protein